MVHEYAHRVDVGEACRAILIFNTDSITYKPRKILSEEEKNDILKEYKVAVWNRRAYEYYKKLVSSLGKYARYTLYSDLLLNSFFDKKHYLRLKILKFKQKEKHFYLTKIPPYILIKTAYVLRRNLNIVQGFQRLLRRKRVKKDIPDYISYEQGLFPSNITCILVQKPKIRNNFLYLPLKYGSLIIVDGQHRLYGFHTLDEEVQKKFDIPCAIFDTKTLNEIDRSNLFVTINTQAKKPPPNLLLDINRESILVKITKILKEYKVFRNKISFEETNLKNKISATTFVSALNKNNIIKERKELRQTVLSGYLIDMLGPHCRPEDYAKELRSYFNLWKTSFHNIWDNQSKYVICTNRGMRVILKLMPYILRYFLGENRKLSNVPKRKLKEIRSVLWYLRKKLKEEKKIRNFDLKGKYLGEAGANDMFNDWVYFMGEKDPGLEYSINPLEREIRTDPTDFEKTVKKLDNLLLRAHKSIWIADWYFDGTGLDNFWVDFRCKEIKILMSTHHFSSRSKRKIINFEKDIKRKGINIEVRVIPKEQLKIHMRFLFIDGNVYTTDASWNNVFKKETIFNLTSNPKQYMKKFNKLWNGAKKIENYP